MNARLYRWHASNDFCNASKADIRERPLSLQLSAKTGRRSATELYIDETLRAAESLALTAKCRPLTLCAR